MRGADTRGHLEQPAARGLAGILRRLSPPQLFALVWAILATGPWLASVIGHQNASLLLFSACAAIALGSQAGRGSHHLKWSGPRMPITAAVFGLGLLAGWGVGPALGSSILQLGGALGLEPAKPVASDWAMLAGSLVLAPVFEEIVYRERLFPWLRIRTGFLPAALLSSLAFAIPHPGHWSTLAAFVTGLVLASLRATGGTLPLCVAVHAGLNLAGELAAAGAWGSLLSPVTSVALGIPTTVGVAQWSRQLRGRGGS